MEVKIVQKLVNSKPRKNFFCLLDDVKLKIIDIRGDIATMQNGNQYKTDDLRPYIMRYNGHQREEESSLTVIGGVI